jgi:hypothetical protein
MHWTAFLNLLSPAQVSRAYGANTIATALGDRAEVNYCPFGRNLWYPGGYAGVVNGVRFRGCRYVDMEHSYSGQDDAFCSEANFCAILMLIDPHSRRRFLAHISAETKVAAMRPDLQHFLASIDGDLGRPELYIFRGTDARNEELELAMDLLSSCISDPGLSWLAMSSHFVEGEHGESWRAYSSVYSKYTNGRQKLNVMFAAN